MKAVGRGAAAYGEAKAEYDGIIASLIVVLAQKGPPTSLPDNVTVLTSSSGSETPFEDAKWEHGAFTKVLLEALDDPAADLNRNRLISLMERKLCHDPRAYAY